MKTKLYQKYFIDFSISMTRYAIKQKKKKKNCALINFFRALFQM